MKKEINVNNICCTWWLITCISAYLTWEDFSFSNETVHIISYIGAGTFIAPFEIVPWMIISYILFKKNFDFKFLIFQRKIDIK